MIKRVLFFNQVTGPLFLETAEKVSDLFCEESILFTGDSVFTKNENKNSNLKIISAPKYDTSNAIKRLFAWISYSFLSLYQLFKSDKSTLIFFVSNPPIMSLMLFPFLKLMRRRYVILIYDIHPDVFISLRKLRNDSALVRMWRFLNKHVYENADCIFTIGNHMRDVLRNQFDEKKTLVGKINVLPIWANTHLVKPIKKSQNEFAQRHNQVDYFTVLYSGNIGASHDIETILEAAELLLHERDIKFVFIGDGQKRKLIEKYIFDKGDRNNISLLPLQSENIFPLSIAIGDISLVTLDKGAERLMIPSKVSYYLAAGSAIIGICDKRNDLYEMLIKSEAGFVVSSGASMNLADAIMNIKNDKDRLSKYKANARNASETIFSKQVSLKRLKKVFEQAKFISKDKV